MTKAKEETGTVSLGQLSVLFERLYREGKLGLMTAPERREQVARAIADAEALKKQAEQKLKSFSH